MSPVVPLDLALDAGVDFATLLTLNGLSGTQFAAPGSTAQLVVRGFPLDTVPLFVVSTTPSASGSLVLGVGAPLLAVNCTSFAALEQLGLPFSASQAPPVPLEITVATLGALAALNTTPFSLGDIGFVQAGAGSWFAWSPGDTLTPNGTTIVATTGGGPPGNWLLAGTVTITITSLAAATLSGFSGAYFDLLLTWGNGTTTNLVSGTIRIAQTKPTVGAAPLPPPSPPPGSTVGLITPGTPYVVLPTDATVEAPLGGGDCVAVLPGSVGSTYVPTLNEEHTFLNISTNAVNSLTIKGSTIEDYPNPGNLVSLSTVAIGSPLAVTYRWDGTAWRIVG